MSGSPTVERYYALAEPGCCAFCSKPLPEAKHKKGRKRKLCSSADCRAMYERLVAADRYAGTYRPFPSKRRRAEWDRQNAEYLASEADFFRGHGR